MIALFFSVLGILLILVGWLWVILSMAAREDERWGDK